MTVQIAIEKVGTRIYVTGNTFAVKDRLKAAGCHWDGERRQWWIGAAKADKIEGIVGGLDGKEIKPEKEELSRKPLQGKAEYKGRTYYILAFGQSRMWLVTLDESINFWADSSACRIVKRYEQPDRNVRGYAARFQRSAPTLASIREFVVEQKEGRAQLQRGETPTCGRGECSECGEHGPMGERCRECHEGCFV